MPERQIEIRTKHGNMTTFEFTPDPDTCKHQDSYPLALYLMDMPSIRPALKDMARRLANSGYYVLLPFLYYRHSPFLNFEKSDLGMHKRRELMHTVKPKDFLADAQALITFASGNKNADMSRKIGAVGFCMSGPLVMALAQNMAEKIGAVASVHGVFLVNDKDDSPHKQLDNISAEVYLAWADADPTATVKEMHIMDTALKDAGLTYTIDFMQGALHGFAPPGGERYNKDASEKHWERVFNMFKRNL